MKLTRVLLSSVAAIMIPGAAHAADLIVMEPEPMAVMPSAHDWSGAYVGVSGGYGMGTVDWDGEYFLNDVGVGGEDGSYDIAGWLFGVQAGANMQMDSFVLGIEGDISWTNLSGEGDPIDPQDATPTVPSGSIEWLGTLRGRAGVAIDQVLLYGTAGLAYGTGSIELTNLDGDGDDRTADITAPGYVVGFGAEVALDDNLSIKGEYTYTSLTMDEVEFGAVPPADYLAVNSEIAIHAFKVGLNYSF
jgi:outer membrane immunogenic protein